MSKAILTARPGSGVDGAPAKRSTAKARAAILAKADVEEPGGKTDPLGCLAPDARHTMRSPRSPRVENTTNILCLMLLPRWQSA